MAAALAARVRGLDRRCAIIEAKIPMRFELLDRKDMPAYISSIENTCFGTYSADVRNTRIRGEVGRAQRMVIDGAPRAHCRRGKCLRSPSGAERTVVAFRRWRCRRTVRPQRWVGESE